MSGPLAVLAQTVVETLPRGSQPDAVVARQMQALSLAVHIPVVCMGIAFLAAVYLAGDAGRAGRPDLDLYDGLTSGRGLAMVVVSAAGGAATLLLIWLCRFGLARLTAAVAVAAITVGWVFAQDPYLLPGSLKFDDGTASDATLQALVIGVGIGAILLVPSFVFLYRLVLQGRLDQTYEPLDQRFRPAEPR